MTNLTLTQKYKLFQRLTGWSRDRIRANDKAVKDLLSDGGGGGGGGDGGYSTNVAKLTDGQYTNFDEVPEGIASSYDDENPTINEGWTVPPFNSDLWDFDSYYSEFDRVEETNHEMYYNAIYISQNPK